MTLTPPSVVDAPEEEYTAQEESPQADLLDAASSEDAQFDILYDRAVAAVRTTENPTASGLQLELRIEFNHAALLLARMEDEGVIENDQETGEYVVAVESVESVE